MVRARVASVQLQHIDGGGIVDENVEDIGVILRPRHFREIPLFRDADVRVELFQGEVSSVTSHVRDLYVSSAGSCRSKGASQDRMDVSIDEACLEALSEMSQGYLSYSTNHIISCAGV